MVAGASWPKSTCVLQACANALLCGTILASRSCTERVTMSLLHPLAHSLRQAVEQLSWPKTLSASPVSHDEHESGSDELLLVGKPGDGLTCWSGFWDDLRPVSGTI